MASNPEAARAGYLRPRSPLWLVVLSLACEEPMHPYRMQALIKQRGKDGIANVAQRNSVYQTIEALRRAGLIEARSTGKAQRRPEHTVYAGTAEGRRRLRLWITSALSTLTREFPLFPAALATLDPTLSAAELASLLEERANAIQARQAQLEKPIPGLPRLFLLESEYMAALGRAEERWLRGVIDDLRSGRLSFPTLDQVRALASIGGPSEAAIRQVAADRDKQARASARRRKSGSGKV